MTGYRYKIVPTQPIRLIPRNETINVSMYIFRHKRAQRSTTVTPEDRNEMIELVKRIARETDPKRLAVWIEDLNGLIQSKVKELRESRKTG
jgi:hypothetical protein